MLFQSEHVTAASGSVGGVTYSHNRSGMYRRARAVPVNPNTGNQNEVRAAMTDLVTRWIDTVTAAERTAWNLYGANVAVTNALGATINNSGQNWYVGNNTPRLQASAKLGAALSRIDAAPTIFDRGDFTTPTIGLASAATGLEIGYEDTDPWTSEDNAALLIFQGAPQNQSVNFFKGPWRLVARVEGDSVTPPTAPLAINAAQLAAFGFVIANGQRMWLSFSVTRADGRLTTRRDVGPSSVTA